MEKTTKKISIIFIMLSVFFTLSSAVTAHDLDASYSIWSIKEDGIVIAMYLKQSLLMSIGDIDKNNDQVLTEKELEDALPTIIQPYFDSKLSVYLDGKKYPVVINDIKTDETGQVKFICSVDYDEKRFNFTRVKIDYQLFYKETNNGHQNFAYISTPATGDDLLDFIFDYNTPVWEGDVIKKASLLNNIKQFVILGIKHILTGYDHILFLLALVVISLSFKEVLQIITSFTLAHSITLFLAALKIVNLNPRFVESVIALSICYIAFENMYFNKAHHRWSVAFGFGLIHGFGFASILQNFNITRDNFISSLLSFNAGVELGQLTIFLVLLPVLWLLGKATDYKKVSFSLSLVVFILGFIWLVERLFAIQV